MRDLEEQIRDLADATFAKTQPVSPPVRRNGRRTGWLYAAGAAAAVVVVSAAAVLVQSPNDEALSTAAGAAHLNVDDPLSIELDELVERSDKARLQRLAPFMTFDFDALGPDWDSTLTHAITIPSRADTNEYWQQTAVETPAGGRLVVNVQGPLEAGITVTTLPETQAPTEPITVRGQPGRAGPSWIEWIEQNRVTVHIVPGPGSAASVELRSEMLELAEQLDTHEVADLQWSTEDVAGPPVGDSPVRLSGVLSGTTWQVVSSPDGTTSLAVDDRLASSLGERQPGAEAPNREIELSLAPISVPGGTLAWGSAPSTVTTARLTLANGDTARLPTAESTSDRSLFAVPIPDELDPVSLEFLDADGGTVADYNLTWLTPYMGGSISTTVPIG